MASLVDRFKDAWNVFSGTENRSTSTIDYGETLGYRQDRPRLSFGNERSILNSIFTRMAIDVASYEIHHARVDGNGRFLETINSLLETCLSLEANVDQGNREFIMDVVLSLFDEGCIAIVPVDTTVSIVDKTSFDTRTMRTGKILQWYPRHVKVLLYDDRKGCKKEIILPKASVAIVDNPLYLVMNAPNSTLRRLIHKLNLLDERDQRESSGKLDIIIQLPYVIKTEAKKNEAIARRKDIEMQLTGSKYGIAYIDGTERVTQLNRPAENNLLTQIESLTKQLYSQLGITEEIFNGTADEQTMLNYENRTLEPILSAITDSITRKFLTKTARTQGQAIVFFRDPFKLVPISKMAELADKFTRNEILTSNEFRGIIGFKPSEDPKADTLLNKNLNYMGQPTADPYGDSNLPGEDPYYDEGIQNGV